MSDYETYWIAGNNPDRDSILRFNEDDYREQKFLEEKEEKNEHQRTDEESE